MRFSNPSFPPMRMCVVKWDNWLDLPQEEPSKEREDESPPVVRPAPTSTIQYIPISQGIRALHIIPPSSRAGPYTYDRGTTTTIHYPATSVVIQSVPPLVVATSPVSTPAPTTAPSPHQDKQLLQLVSTTTSISSPQPTIAQVTPTKCTPKPHQTTTSQAQQTQSVQFVQTVKTISNANETVSPLSDQHIRVLTPSEIMRTLPSIGQETYDTPPSTVSLLHDCLFYLFWNSFIYCYLLGSFIILHFSLFYSWTIFLACSLLSLK